MNKKDYKFETLQLHAGQETIDKTTNSRSVSIHQTAAYVFNDCDHAKALFDLAEPGNIYTRIMNPTNDTFETRMAALEGGKAALAVASGTAAVLYSIQNIASAGDHVVSANTIYGGTYNLFANTLPEFGIKTTFVNPDNISEFQSAIKENTKAIFIENIGNPNANIVDIEAVAKVAHDNNIPLIVDNTFATPYLMRPIEYGADIVVHSATKFIGGHGTSIGGVVVDAGNFDWAKSGKFKGLTEPCDSYHGVKFVEACGDIAYIIKMRVTLLRDTGACISPFNSFMFLQGLETLSLRVERHVFNALAVVEFLEKHPLVEKVNHPAVKTSKYNSLYEKYFKNGGCSIFTIEIKGGLEETKKFVESLELFSLVANVADAKSLVIHPASTTHSQLNEADLLACNIKPTTVRLSVGLEHKDDILADLTQALDKIK